MPRGRKKKRKKRKRKCVRLVVKNVTNYFRIDVIDVNDETPKFVKSEIFAGVSTEDKNNKVIERLQVCCTM